MSSTFMSCIIWNNGTESELGIRCNIGSIHFFCFCWSLENVLAQEGRAQTECFAISGYSRNTPLWKSLIISSWRVPLPVLEAEVIHLFSQLLNFIDVQSHTFQRLYFEQPSFRHCHLETRSRKVLMYMGHRMTISWITGFTAGGEPSNGMNWQALLLYLACLMWFCCCLRQGLTVQPWLESSI